jgi:ketosteroid isomerase-like protein
MKATMLSAVPVLSSLIIAAACAGGGGPARDTSTSAAQAAGPTDDPAVRAAIDSANRKFETAFKNGDVATTSSFYEDNAVSRHAHMEPMNGRAAIGKGFGDFLKMVGKINDFSVQRQELDIYADHLVEIGTYSMSFTPMGAKDAIRDHGSYLNYWRKQPDGSWKIHRDVDVSAMPVPGDAPPAAAKK